MSYDDLSISASIKKYRNLIIAMTLLIVLAVGALMAFTGWLGRWLDWHSIRKIESNINAVNQNNNLIRENLNGLSIDNRLQEEEVNHLTANYNAAKNAVNQSRETINRAEQNLNRVRGNRQKNVNMTDAMKALCDYDPAAEGCHL